MSNTSQGVLKIIIQGRILEKVITRFLLLEQTNFKESVQYPLNFIFSLIYASNSIYFQLKNSDISQYEKCIF